MSSDLLERLKKNSTVKDASVLSESTIFEDRPLTDSGIPILNLAMSGKLDGGFPSGLHLMAGASKMFKSTMALICAAAYLKKYDDAIVMFYDSEFGSPKEYFKSLDIDSSRVLHTPITDVEELKFDLVKQLTEIKRGDHVVIVIDSIGNLASKKETEDAMNQKSVADMSRAKSFKSLFRIVTPHLTLKDIPMFAIAHTYMTMDFIPKAVVAGGCLLAGTKVVTPDGVKSIEDFVPGDKVISSDGKVSIVKNTWNPETLVDGTPECFEVEFDDGSKVRCSENQKFLMDGKWVSVKDVVVGDDLDTI